MTAASTPTSLHASGAPGSRREGGPLSSANPVTKLAVLVVLSIPLLLTIDIVSAGVALVLIVAAAPLSGYGFGRLARTTWPVVVLAPIVGISMVLYAKPQGALYASWGPITISDNSISLGIAVTIRAIALALPAVILFNGVGPTAAADGLIQVAHLPDRFVLGALAGARLISLFAEDWRSMELARRSRGLGDGSRLRRFPAMAFTLLVFAVRRGSALATAMEARGFGGATPRTHARVSRLRRVDMALLAGGILVALVAVGASVVAGTFRVVGS